MISNTNSVVYNIYYLLWIKDSGLQESKFPVRIPDTIIINGRQISNWFFTGSNDQVLKKKVNHLLPDAIFDSFTKNDVKSGIVAQIIQGEQKGEKLTKIQQKAQQSHLLMAHEDEKVMIRYLTVEQLHKFLFQDLNELNLDESLILQKFINPYGEHNNNVQAIWSPSTCVFNKRVNNKKLNDTQYDSYERAVTFDGPEILSKAVCLKGKQISGEIRKLCEFIVKRVAHVTYERTMINRMTLYFKADKDNRLYFQYCTSLRLKDEIKNIVKRRETDPEKYMFNNTPLIIENNFQRPQNIKNTYSISNSRPMRMENNLACLSCDMKYQFQDMMEIPFSFLLRFENFSKDQNIMKPHYLEDGMMVFVENQQKISQNRNNKKNQLEVQLTNQQVMEFMNSDHTFDFDQTKLYVGSNQAPPHPLLAKIYPKMSKENYVQFKEKGYFDNLYIKMCHNCYYYYTQNYVISGAPLLPSENVIEIKRNIAQKGSQLFTPKMHKIALEKNLELALEYDYAKHLNPQIYQQRLEILQRNDQNLVQQQSQPPFKKHLENTENNFQNQNEDYQTFKNNLRRHSQQNLNKIKQTQNLIQTARHDNVSAQEKQASLQREDTQILPLTNTNRKGIEKFDYKVSIARPLTTQMFSTIDSALKSQKRFDLLINLAQKGLKSRLNDGNNQKLVSSPSFSKQKIETPFMSYRDYNKNSNNNNSKHTSTTNDDSFIKQKEQVLEMYVSEYDKNNKFEFVQQSKEDEGNIHNISQDQPKQNKLDKKQSVQTRFSINNSKNSGQENITERSQNSANLTDIEKSSQKFLNSQKNSNQQSYFKYRNPSLKGNFQQNNFTNFQSSYTDSTELSLNSLQTYRPSTTQNSANRLHTIKEINQIQSSSQIKPFISPYLSHRSQNKFQISYQKQFNKKQKERNQNSEAISDMRNIKSYTSHSSRAKFISTSSNKNIESPLHKDKKGSNSKNKNEILLTESSYQVTNTNLNSSLNQQVSTNHKILDLKFSQIQTNSAQNLLTNRTDEFQIGTTTSNNFEKTENDNTIFDQKSNDQCYSQNENHSLPNKDQNALNDQDLKISAQQFQINTYFSPESDYNKKMQEMIQDYQDQKD
ncbi:hypothetical protein ABPG72_017350 [Tetrahymena utriculariae]